MTIQNTNGNQKADGTFAKGHKLGNRFKPGESGNPAGKPPGAKRVSTVLREMMERVAPREIKNTEFVKEFCKGRKKVTIADALAARLLTAALIEGESWAVREILDRLEGKAPQSIDIDMTVGDWRTLAAKAGIDEKDVVAEAKLLIAEQSVDDPSR